MIRNLIGIAFLILLAAGCVPNRKYVYLQKKDVNKRVLPIDSVVRNYNYEPFEYLIQSQDVLSIRFESLTPEEIDFFSKDVPTNAMFSQQANPLLIGELVDNNGEVPFPVVGKVKVKGLTIFQAQEHLQTIANQYLDSPIVKVRLINFRITVLGEVLQEGTVTLNNNRVTMLEAIGMVGGLTDLADKRHVKLIRMKEGKAEVQYLDFLNEEFVNSPFYFVHQNDILIVPPLRQRPYRKYFGQNLTLLISSLTLAVLTLNLVLNFSNSNTTK